MGHMAMNGARGTIEQLAGVRVGRNSSSTSTTPTPRFAATASERARVEAAGWRVAHDGLAVELGSPAMIADDARPRLPRGVRLREDKVRDRWVLLAPERVRQGQPDRGRDPQALRRLAHASGDRRRPRRSASTPIPRGSGRTCGRSSPRSPKRGWPSYERNAAAARGPARRADPSLPARLPLLLQPGRARCAAQRDEH